MALLHRHGADVDAPNAEDLTPLRWAASLGRLPTVQWLLAHGASVDARSARGTTALMTASSLGLAPVVSALAAAGARVDLRDAAGLTPPMHAARLPNGFNKARVLTTLTLGSGFACAALPVPGACAEGAGQYGATLLLGGLLLLLLLRRVRRLADWTDVSSIASRS
jgi:hypothetical protein